MFSCGGYRITARLVAPGYMLHNAAGAIRTFAGQAMNCQAPHLVRCSVAGIQSHQVALVLKRHNGTFLRASDATL
jgi:hypothetical protein